MALFNFKKKEEKKPCCCTCGVPSQETTATNECCGKAVEGICCIKVLGAGCKSCHEQYENAKKAVRALGLDVEVEYITDMEKVMSYGVMSMPALLVNDKIVSVGKVLKPKEVEALIGQSINA